MSPALIDADRIPFGEEVDDPPFYIARTNERCPDCQVERGELHVPGCDGEQCPACGQQLIGCDCYQDSREHTHYCEDCDVELALLYDDRDDEETQIVCGHCGGTNTREIHSEQ